MKQTFSSVDGYVAAQAPEHRTAIAAVRTAIRKALPSATETILYDMPTYKIGGVRILHFAAWKKHYALYAASAGVVAALKDELKPYSIEKGTIRFPWTQPVPAKLIEKIAKLKAAEHDVVP